MPVRQRQSATAAAVCPRPQGSGAASLFCPPPHLYNSGPACPSRDGVESGVGAVASPGTKPALSLDTLESNSPLLLGSIEATPHPGVRKAIVLAARGQGPPFCAQGLACPWAFVRVGRKSTAGLCGEPGVLLPFPRRRLEQGHLNSSPVMRSGNLEERDEAAPAVQHLPAPLARLQAGAGYWGEVTWLLKACPSTLGVQGAMEAWSPGGRAFFCSRPGPALSSPGSWPVTRVSWLLVSWHV